MQTVVDQASNETGRSMTVTDASVDVESSNGVGAVTLSVAWENLAAVEGDQLTMTEPFASGFEPNRTFTVITENAEARLADCPVMIAQIPVSNEFVKRCDVSAGSLDQSALIFLIFVSDKNSFLFDRNRKRIIINITINDLWGRHGFDGYNEAQVACRVPSARKRRT